MKKILAFLLAVMMMLSLVACGNKDGSNTAATADEFEGDWIGVGGDAWGIAFTAEDAAAYVLSVSGSKASVIVDGEAMEATCKTDGNTITLEIEALDMSSTGTLEDGAIYFEDLLGLGINIYFAKEGTDAADPALYIPEADSAMVGTWYSYAVTDILDEDASDVFPEDALIMNFNGDYTVDIELDGEMKVGETWTLSEDFGFLTDSDYDFTWDVVEDEIVVSYYDGSDTYKFICEKA